MSLGYAQGQDYTTTEDLSRRQQKQWEQAQADISGGRGEDALKTLDKLLEDTPDFIDGRILRGQLLHDRGNFAEAEAEMEQVVALDARYDPENLYLLALIEWKTDQYAESAAHFQQFLDNGVGREYLRERAEKYLASASFAAEAVQNPVPFDPQPLSDRINTTEGGEYWPSLTADESFLLYTRRIQRQEDLYYSQKIDGEWAPGRPFEGLNSPGNEGLQTISADGRTLVFTACNRRDGLGSCDLYLVEINANYFTPPVNIGPPVNTPAWDSQPSLSSDGRTLFFASERGGGLGDRDIWMSQKQTDGRWSKPVNLGPNVNSSGGDQAPFLHPDGQTLYFMSNGRPGMGGFDLYLSRKQPDGSWGAAENLGYPINTKANEGALFINLEGTTAYFTSDQADDRQEQQLMANNNQDIYYFELPEGIRPQAVTYVQARVFDAKTKEPLEATAEINEVESGAAVTAQPTDRQGGFLICLPTGRNYSLSVDREGYLFYSDYFALRESRGTEPFLLEIPLQPIPKKTETAGETESEEKRPIVLRNIFFETGSARLKPSSRTELERLRKLLEDNPDLRIQINGHTDNVGEEANNQLLSEQRAKAVYDYLAEEGIKADRLRYKGFGESRPVADNDTEEGRRRNRRTEFLML